MAHDFCTQCSGFKPQFDVRTSEFIHTLNNALEARMSEINPHRLAHCKSVAQTSSFLAHIYHEDETKAYIAGLLHDWDKVLTREEQIEKAKRYHIDLGCDLNKVAHLLHGYTAACDLEERFPELTSDIIDAIRYHTCAREDMCALDMMVFVADGIEPLRTSVPAIEHTRELVGDTPLFDVFFDSFASGLSYVLETRRFLYPHSILLYNNFLARE